MYVYVCVLQTHMKMWADYILSLCVHEVSNQEAPRLLLFSVPSFKFQWKSKKTYFKVPEVDRLHTIQS